MSVVTAYSRLYAEAVSKSLRGLAKNAWTLLLPMALVLAWTLAGSLVAPLGIIGGFVMGLLMAALASCYLYFLGEVVSGAPVKLAELKQSVGRYFWAVINVFFIFWIARLVVGLVGGPSAGALMLALYATALIAFNAVPETLYQRGTYGGLATLQASFEFLKDNALPWFLPNLVLLGLGWLALQGLLQLGGLASWLVPVVGGALLHLGMVFRGHLFRTLSTSSHRQRLFRYREGGDAF